MNNIKEIFEITIYGRGGQGAKTASQFIAESALGEGKYIQAFPEYGPERAGAPVKAYVRISNRPITNYAPIINPDVVLVIDSTLLEFINVGEGLTDKGILLVNTQNNPEEIRKQVIKFKGKIYSIDATKISIDTVGVNLPNTPMLGALIKITGLISITAVKECVKKKFLTKLGDEKTNATIKGIELAYNKIKE